MLTRNWQVVVTCKVYVQGLSGEKIKKDSVVAQDKSKGHLEALARLKAKNALPGETKAEMAIQKLNESAFQMRDAHAIAKYRQSF